MPDEIQVFVQIAGEDVPAGQLWPHRRRNTESATFRYFSDYIGRAGAYPLDPLLPLSSQASQTPAGRAIFGARDDLRQGALRFRTGDDAPFRISG